MDLPQPIPGKKFMLPLQKPMVETRQNGGKIDAGWGVVRKHKCGVFKYAKNDVASHKNWVPEKSIKKSKK